MFVSLILSLSKFVKFEKFIAAMGDFERYKSTSLKRLPVSNPCNLVALISRYSIFISGSVLIKLILVNARIKTRMLPSCIVSIYTIDESFRFKYLHVVKFLSSIFSKLVSLLFPTNSTLVLSESVIYLHSTPRQTISLF